MPELQPFTRNFEDNSTDAGFQFTFYCDICGSGYKTKFVQSKTYKKAGFLRGFGRAVSIGADLAGVGRGGTAEAGTSVLAERFEGMSPEWHKEHEQAFGLAQNEAMGHFQRCPRCTKWVCENDWNDQEGLCIEDAPRLGVEVAAAKAQVAREQVWEKARKTSIFTGKIESKQTICPQCGKPSGGGKFCNNCGAPLTLMKCQECGAQNSIGTRFCSECGAKLG